MNNKINSQPIPPSADDLSGKNDEQIISLMVSWETIKKFIGAYDRRLADAFEIQPTQ